jgi:hypothetical protein
MIDQRKLEDRSEKQRATTIGKQEPKGRIPGLIDRHRTWRHTYLKHTLCAFENADHDRVKDWSSDAVRDTLTWRDTSRMG